MSEPITIGRRVAAVADLELPGDYSGPHPVGPGRVGVWFLKPNARDPDAAPRARSVQWVSIPPHTYRECPDGSLEIRASIGDTVRGGGASDGWHGYLDEGHVWRDVGCTVVPPTSPAAPSADSIYAGPLFDPCTCGDLRHHHAGGPCVVCAERPGALRCPKFEEVPLVI